MSVLKTVIFQPLQNATYLEMSFLCSSHSRLRLDWWEQQKSGYIGDCWCALLSVTAKDCRVAIESWTDGLLRCTPREIFNDKERVAANTEEVFLRIKRYDAPAVLRLIAYTFCESLPKRMEMPFLITVVAGHLKKVH